MEQPSGIYAAEARAGDMVTLLDHFAGMAMQGRLAYTHCVIFSKEEFAEECYNYAEAMLREREKRNKQ